MGFLLSVHRSILDPAFYDEVRGGRVVSAVRYLLTLTAVAALVGTIGRTSYFVDAENGFPARAAEILQGTEIVDGVFYPGEETPHVARRSQLAEIFRLILPVAEPSTFVPDSAVVIDTTVAPQEAAERSGLLIFTRRHLVAYPGTFMARVVPYVEVFGDADRFRFTPQAIRGFVMAHLVGIALQFAFVELAFMAFHTLFGIAFLNIAAYILRAGRTGHRRESLLMACYAVTPLTVGMAIQEMAGTAVEGIWYVFICVSLFVLLRGVRRIIRNESAGADTRTK